MTDYDQIIDALFRTPPADDPKRGLEVAAALNAELHYPSSAYPCIHVAGSNGKGSVTTKIAKVLELSGYRVGLYTSPHLFSFCERIAVSGEAISEEDAVKGLKKVFAIKEKLKITPTFFELITFLAFDYFRQKEIDVAVIETGIGGRLDATNVLNPILSIITSISKEHSHLLGSEIEQIAAEKAGIIKEGVPVVLGPKARCRAIYDRAQQLNSPLFASKKISYFFDEENSALARLSLEQLTHRFAITPSALEEGLLSRPPCRFEQLGEAIFDVAHNPEAVFSLLQALHTFFPKRQFRFLVGFSKDKEFDHCLRLIADVATHLHLVQANSSRAATTKELETAMKSEDPSLSTSHFSIEHAVEIAYSKAVENKEILVICGSFYIMLEAKAALQNLSCTILPSGLSCSSAVN